MKKARRERRCKSYCGLSCIDGTCPIANREEYEERGYPVPKNCGDCYRYEGCEDCCFDGTEYCEKYKREA